MTEQQYTVVADRDKGDDPSKANIRVGDRYTLQDTGTDDDPLVRIERLVPTTDEPQEEDRERAWVEHAAANNWYEYPGTSRETFLAGWNAYQAHPSPHPPTREQIAEALNDAADEIERILVRERTTLGMSVQDWLRQRAALIQNGADR